MSYVYADMQVPTASARPNHGEILYLLFQCVCCAEDLARLPNRSQRWRRSENEHGHESEREHGIEPCPVVV